MSVFRRKFKLTSGPISLEEAWVCESFVVVDADSGLTSERRARHSLARWSRESFSLERCSSKIVVAKPGLLLITQ